MHIISLKITFSMKRGYVYVWGVCMCEFCGYAFFNVILNLIIFSMKRGYSSA